MQILLVVWLVIIMAAVAILLETTITHKYEKIGGEIAAALIFCAFPFTFVVFSDFLLLILMAVTQLWLLLLPARLVFGRLEHEFLEKSTRSNALFGLGIILVVTFLQWWHPAYLERFIAASVLAGSFAFSVWCLGQQAWNARRYKTIVDSKVPFKKLPTVSVCIPARNEDHALAACLTSVLASDYPKLEILVLDDCSQDKTSEVIKSFAHEGVRFVQGKTPATGWLGKNLGRQILAEQASGDYLLFLDVDTHVSRQSITQLVNYALANRLQMISVLPQNRLGASASTIFGTLNYMWRLVVPITKKHIPISSSCWLINAASLKHLGGFDSASRKIMPEESFARRLADLNSYRFIAGDAYLHITTGKRWSSQIETSLRLSYPNLQRQPAKVLAAYALLFSLGLLPFFVAGYRIVTGYYDVLFWLALFAIAFLYANYFCVLRRLQPHTWLIAGLLWPLAVMQEATLFAMSMLLYEFGEVNWKGRNVCYPVIARLPQQTSSWRDK